MYPIPETGYDIPRTLAKLARRGDDASSFTRPLGYFMSRNEFVFGVFDALGSERVLRVYPHERLCSQSSCAVFADGKVLYSDDDHLSLDGARYVGDQFEPVFGQGLR
jgi:hypothetical protein